MSGEPGFTFNHELFLDAKDRDWLVAQFPRVGFAFYVPEAAGLFRPLDEAAKAAKTRFLRFGLAVVALALTSLAAAAAEAAFAPKGDAAHSSNWWLLALVSALLGVAASIVGSYGLGIGKRKQVWLRNRYICERIRQWQYQYICLHADSIVAASRSASDQERYSLARQLAFEAFRKNHVTNVDAQLAAFDEGADEADAFVAPLNESRSGTVVAIGAGAPSDANTRDELYRAYRQIRFEGQESFVKQSLRSLRLKTHAKRQLEVFYRVGQGLLYLILFLHLLIVVGALFDVPPLKSATVYFLALLAALCALALRVVEDGFQPHAHIRRYQGYLSEIRASREEFDKAVKERDDAKTAEQMLRLERAASNELLAFGRTVESARFVL